MKNLATKIKAAASAEGCRAATPAGILRWVKKHGTRIPHTPRQDRTAAVAGYRIAKIIDRAPIGTPVPPIPDKSVRLITISFSPLSDKAAQERAVKAIGMCGQRSNVERGGPRITGIAHQARWESGRYKGRWSGKTWHHLKWCYQSCLAVSQSGRMAAVITECKLIRRILAPKGVRFAVDTLGVKVVRTSDNLDWHPSPDDWCAKDFATRCHHGLAEKYNAQLLAARRKKQDALDAAIATNAAEQFRRDSGKCRVTFADSRKAGNCVEGTLRFAELRLGIDRETVLRGGHLVSFAADVLRSRAHAGGDAHEIACAEMAIRCAWERETTIAI